MIHVPLGDPVGKRAPSTRASRCAAPEAVRIWLLMAGGSNPAKPGSVVGKNVGYPMETGRIMVLEGEFAYIVYRGGRVPRFPAQTYIFPSWLLRSLRSSFPPASRISLHRDFGTGLLRFSPLLNISHLKHFPQNLLFFTPGS